MNRIYISMILTALMSFFLLGQLLGMLFEIQDNDGKITEFALQRNLLDGLSKQLSRVNPEQLHEQVQLIASDYRLSLSLELFENLSIPAQLKKNIVLPGGLLLDSEDGVYLLKSIDAYPGYLLELTLQDGKPNKSNFEIWLSILFYSGFCLLLILWAFPLSRRLAMLNQMALKFGMGELDERVKPGRFSYIEQLEKSFNRMADQIEELLSENKLLAGSISHDLRTPLSCLRFGVDAAIENNNPDTKDYYLGRIDEDLARMEVMLDAFLEYAKMDRKGFELSKTSANLYQLVTEVIDECTPLAQNKNCRIDCSGAEYAGTAMLNIDVLWIKRALTNLIDNAIKFSRYTVKVSCAKIDKQLVVSVQDDGAGVPADEAGNIFKAFVQLDKSRTQRNESFGLGLAIVARVANWHNAKVEVSSSEELGGARFDFCFPLSEGLQSLGR